MGDLTLLYKLLASLGGHWGVPFTLRSQLQLSAQLKISLPASVLLLVLENSCDDLGEAQCTSTGFLLALCPTPRL